MTVLTYAYSGALAKLINGDVDFASLKLMLLDDVAAFVIADATLNAVAGVGHGREVYGNGWVQGGVTLSSVGAVTTGDYSAMLTANNVSVLASGGSIGTAYNAVIYDDASVGDVPLLFIDLGFPRSAGNGTLFNITFDDAGLVSFGFV